MPDLDQVLSGPGAPTLSELFSAAKGAYEKGKQDGPQSRVISRLETTTTRDGCEKIIGTVPNLTTIFMYDNRWNKRIWMNMFRNAIKIDDKDFSDTDATRIKRWMYKHYNAHFRLHR